MPSVTEFTLNSVSLEVKLIILSIALQTASTGPVPLDSVFILLPASFINSIFAFGSILFPHST